MKSQKTRAATCLLLVIALLAVACQAPPAPAPAPAPVETVVVEESRGVVRDLNVPGVLSAGDVVVRRSISLPHGSLPWSVFTGVAPEITMTGAVSMTGLLEADAGISVDSTAFTVADATGATTMAGGYGSTGCTVAAAGNLSCNGTGIFGGALTALRPVLLKTANYPVTAADTAALIGTTNAITLTLPGAAVGLNYCIFNQDGADIKIDPLDATDTILVLTNAAGDRLTNTTIGDSVCLVALSASSWAPLERVGTWADGN